MIDPTTLFGSVALVVALMEVVKRTVCFFTRTDFPAELIPITGILVGVAFNLVLAAGYLHTQAFEAGITGLVAGLVAGGVYSGTKATIGK